ncbi:MAG TPA: NADP-dependent oxidoreductase [Anaerolineaceae bacterium]|nr:NADP-dependent oxidoreductase [Anaerolineaceae bacterium]
MSELMMQAIVVNDYGAADQLHIKSIARPVPQAGQVLVHVYAAGVHPVDWKLRGGLYKAMMPLTFPWTPGQDGSGIVESVGPGVNGFPPGQAVYGRFSGSFAEYAIASVADLAPKPDNLSFDQAAAVPVGALTAWGVVIDAAAVQLGQTVLVQGAAGGVGLFAVQLARWKGAHVIGTTSAKNVDFVRSLGAEEVIDYQADPFEMSVHDVDAVIDTVGGDVTERSLHVLRPGGIFVTVANMTPEEQAKALGVRVARGSRPGADVLCQITELIESGKIHPVVGPVFSLAEAGKAQVQGETGHGRGRIILHITDA